ncbi:C2H2-type domain-containing protein, partial [Aphis craccivora]
IANNVNTNIEGISLIHEPFVDYIIDIDALKKCAVKLSTHYYGKFNFSRKDAIQFQQNVTNIITNSIAHELKKLIVDNNTKQNNALKSIINFCENPLVELDTEYKFLKSLQINDYYEKPKIINLDNTIDDVRINNINIVDEKKVKGVILPLKFKFRKYFEAPDILKNDNGFTNFINNKMLFNEDGVIYIPNFLYFDDFEVNNPLGSHSSSILAALFNSKDVKFIGNYKCFYFLIDEINELQSYGINLTLNDGKQFKIKFLLGLVVGDNLGVNSVLGFARSFSSNYFCHFCISDKKSTQYIPLMFLETLNSRKQGFNYDDTEIGNMSPSIKQIKINTLKFKISSREMQTFIHFLPLLIGNLVPENNQIWLKTYHIL